MADARVFDDGYVDPAIPPYSDEAELSVLGAVMLRPDTLTEARTVLAAGDFYRDAHRTVYEAMCRLQDERTAIDPVTLHGHLSAKGRLEAIGGTPFIARLADVTPTSANMLHYARIVAEKARLRRVIVACRAGLAKALSDDGTPVSEVVAGIDRELTSVAAASARVGPRWYRDVAKDVLREVKDAAKGRVHAVQTGFPDIDYWLGGGLHNGELIVLMARPSHGKTTLVTNIIRNMGTGGGVSLVFQRDATAASMVGKSAAAGVGLEWFHLRAGRMSDGDYSRFAGAIAEEYELPVLVDDETPDIPTMLALARHAKRSADVELRGGLSLIVFDYLQLCKTGGRYDTREREVGTMLTDIKAIAKELDVPALVLCQLNRELEKRPDKKPQMSDGRDSGEIEQAADVLASLYWDWVYKRKDYDPNNEGSWPHGWDTVELAIHKQRHGPGKTIKLNFRPKTGVFTCIDTRPEHRELREPSPHYTDDED